ncbi:MAG: 4-hydroxybenzoate--CoA ligase [Acidobacteria bacterium RIFCSPLOWO2_02_FULL_59_13]|nr:MAG: 4-hydroxybenzoate--CoA ligase [Acidobacteria bacterium RIFCSPLOWO2_02_FULL_59_13]
MVTAHTSELSAVRVPDTFNIASYFIDRNLELGHGSKTALYEDGRTINYEQLAAMVNRCGNALRALDIEVENRVLMALPDSAEFVATFFGAAKIGAVPVPVNTAARPDDYLYYLNDSGAQAFVLHDELWPQLQAVLARAPRLRHVIVVPAVPAQTREVSAQPPTGAHYSFHTLKEVARGASSKLEAEPTSKDDVAFFLYTSGSTGGPKGAVHLQHDMLFATEYYARGILQMTDNDIAFSASKLFFAYGLGNGMYFPLGVGAASVMNPHRPKPETIYEYLEKFRPTLFFGVPTLYASMLQIPDKKDLSSVRFGVSAGEALPPEIFQRFQERFGVSILDGIGSTEMLHIFVSNRPDDIRPGTSGKIVPGYESKIVDDAGNALPGGELGNLWVKGDSAAAFYWRKHDLSKRIMIGEWLVTGDKYYVDEQGYHYYCGRSDDMLKVAGQWVSPAEVENALLGFPGVLEAAVVGLEDSDGLVKPKAFLVMKDTPGASTPGTNKDEELRNFLREKLAGFKCPRWFEYVSELPKTPTGKIQRFKLRAR